MRFGEFCESLSWVRWARPRRVVVDALQDLVDGRFEDGDGRRIDRLMIRAPPQLGKTTLAQLFTAWWLSENPSKTAAVRTYSQAQADAFSVRVCAFFRDSGGHVDTAEKRRDWRTAEGGGFWTRSYRPADLLVEDDLDRDLEQALAPEHQRTIRELWYGWAWLHRWSGVDRLLEVNIGTPQHVGDSQNFVLYHPGVGTPLASRHWHLLPLQALHDRERFPIRAPEGTTIAADWREHGQPLALEHPRFSREAVEACRRAMSRDSFAATMMCAPIEE